MILTYIADRCEKVFEYFLYYWQENSSNILGWGKDSGEFLEAILV